MTDKKEVVHLGIERTKQGRPNIDKRIAVARGAMYSLMGAGLHGVNGLNPLLAYKLWKIYVIPRMLHGIETLSILKSDLQKLEAFQRKTLKQILSLPGRTSDAAIYILLGAESVEQTIHKSIIGLYLRILQNENSAEYELAARQLAVKREDSNSWFSTVQEILTKYKLPSAYEIFLNRHIS